MKYFKKIFKLLKEVLSDSIDERQELLASFELNGESKSNEKDGELLLKQGKAELKKLLTMFQFASPKDKAILLAGVVFAVIHGACFPIVAILFSSFSQILLSQISNEDENERNSTIEYPHVSIHNHQHGNRSTRDIHDINLKSARNVSMEEIFGSIGGFLGLSGPGRFGTEITEQEFVSQAILLTFYFLLIAIVVFSSSFLQTLCWESAATNQIFRIRQKFLYQVLRQEISWFDDQPTGDLIVKLADDIERMWEGMGHRFGVIVQYSSCFAIGAFFALCTNWKLALLFGSSVPLIIGKIFYLLNELVKKSIEQQMKLANTGAIIAEVLSDVRTVSAFGTEIEENDKYNDQQAEEAKTARKKFRTIGIYTGILFFFIYASFALAFWYACNKLAQNQIFPEEVFTVLFCISVGVVALTNILPFIPDIANAYGCSKIVTEILSNVPKIDPYSKDGQRLNAVSGKIKMNNVTFSYPARLNTSVLRDISFTIHAGETVAIIGPSTSGKSTIARLLLRFYDPNSGMIMFDNVDLRNLNVSWLREQIGYVSQEIAFEEAPIMDNLWSGRSDISMEATLKMAKLTGAHDFIIKLPKGYRTIIGVTLQLSTGQRQLLSLTRALLREPKVLIIDQALSCVDSISTAKIYKHVRKLRAGLTNIIITHRIDRAHYVDKVLVMENGEIKEHGTPKELLELGKIYARLVSEANADNDNEPEDGEIDEKGGRPQATEPDEDELESDQPDDCMICFDEDWDDFVEELPSMTWELMSNLAEIADATCLVKVGLLGCGICAGVTLAYALVFSQMLITFAEDTDKTIFAHVLLLVALMGSIGIAAGIGYFLRTYFVSLVGEKLSAKLQQTCYISILRESMSWFDEKAHAATKLYVELVSTASFFRVAIGSGLASAITTLASEIFTMIFCIVMAWQFSGIMVISAILMYACIRYGFNSYEEYEGTIASTLEESIAYATKSIQNVRIVQALSEQLEILRKYTDMIHSALELRQDQGVSVALAIAFSNTWAVCTLTAVFSFGIGLIAYDLLYHSILFMIFISLAFCVFSASHLIAFIPELLKARRACRNVQMYDDMCSKIDPFDKDGRKPRSLTPLVFEDVKFSYPQRPEKMILQGVSFKVEKNVCLGIIGGEGKSTILHLLERFYDPVEGSLTLGGVSTNKLRLKYLRKNIGIVPQEPAIFNRSVFENIIYGFLDEETEDLNFEDLKVLVKRIAASVGIDDSWHLPKGLATFVGEFGSQLTGGQKQKIAIARALIRDPQILLLDEPTSALGREEEKMILSALKVARKDRTCIIVSNNPRVIKDVDMIAVLEEGKIIEFGSHSELSDLKGSYYKFMSK